MAGLDLSAIKASYWEEMVYGVLYTMTERVKNQQSMWSSFLGPIFYSTVDYIQLLTLITGSHSGLDRTSVSWLTETLDLNEIVVQGSFSMFVVTFWIDVCIIFSALFLMAFVGYTFLTKRIRILPIKILRALTKILLSALYIPSLKQFITALKCSSVEDPSVGNWFVCMKWPWFLYGGVSLALLVLFVPFCALMALIYHEADPLSKDLESRPHGRFDIIYLLCRTFMVASTHALPVSGLVLNCILFLIITATCIAVILIQPYYRHKMNCYRAGLFSSAAFLAFGSFALSFLDKSDTNEPIRMYGSIVMVLASLGAFSLGYIAVKARYKRLCSARDQDTFRWCLTTEVEVSTRFLRESQTDDDVDCAESIYVQALERFPNSAYVQISYAIFLQSYKNDAIGALNQMKGAWDRSPFFDCRFKLVAWRRSWEQANQTGNLGQEGNFTSVVEFKRLYQCAKEHHNLSLKLLRSFWNGLLKKNLAIAASFENLPAKISAINKAKEEARDSYEQLLKKFPNSKLLLRSYGAFLLSVANDPENAQLQFLRADELEELETRHGGGDEIAASSKGGQRTDSSGGSGGLSKKNMRKFRDAHLANREELAVRRLHRGIIIGIGILMALAATTYVVVYILFKQFIQAVSRNRVASFQRRICVAICSFARSLQLYAFNGNEQAFSETAIIIEEKMASFVSDQHQLYFGSATVPASTDANIISLWRTESTDIQRFVPGNPPYIAVDAMNLWDIGNVYASKVVLLSKLPMSKLVDVSQLPEFRFIFDNGPFGILDVFKQLSTLYMMEVFRMSDITKIVLSSLLVTLLVAIALLILLVFRPAFQKVQGAKRGVQTILQQLPRTALKQIAKFYSKQKLIQDQMEAGTDADAPSDTDSDASERSDASMELHVDDKDLNDPKEDEKATRHKSAHEAPVKKIQSNLRLEVLRKLNEDAAKEKGKAGHPKPGLSALASPHSPADDAPAPNLPEASTRIQPFQLSPRTKKHGHKYQVEEEQQEGHRQGQHEHQPHDVDMEPPIAAEAHRDPVQAWAKGAADEASAKTMIRPSSAKSLDGAAQEKAQSRQAAQDARGDILSKMRRKYLIAFAIVALIAVVNLVLCIVWMDESKYTSSQVDRGGARRYLCRQVALYARELFIDDGNFQTRDDLFNTFRSVVQELQIVMTGIKTGNDSLMLPGYDGKSKAQDELMYGYRCVKQDSSFCTTKYIDNTLLVTQGLDAALSVYVDFATAVLHITCPDLLLDGYASPEALEPKRNYDMDGLCRQYPVLKNLLDMDSNDFLDEGLAESCTIFLNDGISRSDLVQFVEAFMLAINVSYLIVLYLFLFRPMIARLRQESNRTSHLLVMIPVKIVADFKCLHEYFITQEDELRA